MSVMDFLKRKKLTREERRLLDLLLAGDSESLECLRRQTHAPFFMWVERRTPSTKPHIYSTPPNEYVIDLVYDEKLQSKYGLGVDESFGIDDLCIVEAHLRQQVRVIGCIAHGVLTNVRLVAESAVKWPKYIGISDWNYYSDGETSRQRKLLKTFDVRGRRLTVNDLATSWVKDLLLAADGHPAGVTVYRPALQDELSDLQRRLNSKLPSDFLEFLATTDGANILGARVFGIEDLYILDLEGADSLLVFSLSDDGSPLVLNLSELTEDNIPYCTVSFLDHETNETVLLCDSFREWLARFIDVGLQG